MKYEIENIVTYCKSLFEDNKYNKKITFNTIHDNNNVKLIIRCKSYFYDVKLNKEKLLKLKEKGLIQISVQPVVNSLETFGINFKLVFIIDRHKIEKEKSMHSIIRLINFIFDNNYIDILKKEETKRKNEAQRYYGDFWFCYYTPPISIRIVENFSKKFALYAINQLNTEKIRYLSEIESDYYHRYNYYESYNNYEKKEKYVYWGCALSLNEIYIHLKYTFNHVLEKIIKDTNTVYEKTNVLKLKTNVIQLKNGKFLMKSEKKETYYYINSKQAYTYAEKCISGIDINKMTNKEKSTIVDYFLGLSNDYNDYNSIIEKYQI